MAMGNIGFGRVSPLTRRQFIGATAGLAVAANSLVLPARGLTINPRSSWAADLEPKGELGREDVRFLIVHHSASHNGHTPEDVPGILRSWYHFHTGPDKGWPDIAYNFIIDSSGGVWEGRQGSLDGPVAGSATGGNQGFTQLVCVIGDTNVAPATAAAQASLVQVLAWLAERYDVSTAPGAEVTFTSRGSNKWPVGTSVTTPTITGHRDMSETTCPGDNLYSYVVGSLPVEVEVARGGSAPPPTQPSTTSSTTSTTSTTTTTTQATTTTTVAPTTSVPPTTTVPVSTTVAPDPTTTRPSSTTSMPAPSTTIPTQVSSSTTLPVALADARDSGPGAPVGLFAGAGVMILTGAGLVLWRHRRMGGPS